MTRVSKKR